MKLGSKVATLPLVLFLLLMAGCTQEGTDVDTEERVESPESGQAPTDGEETPSEDDETPAEGGETPDEGDETPTEGGETPGGGDEAPAEGGETPGDGDETPGDGGETPTDGGETPGDGGDTPAPTPEPAPEDPDKLALDSFNNNLHATLVQQCGFCHNGNPSFPTAPTFALDDQTASFNTIWNAEPKDRFLNVNDPAASYIISFSNDEHYCNATTCPPRTEAITAAIEKFFAAIAGETPTPPVEQVPTPGEPEPGEVVTPTPVWIGDMEVNNLSEQFGFIINPNKFTLVDDPLKAGNRVAQININGNDIFANINRVELHHKPDQSRTQIGQETYFGWSFYVPQVLDTSSEHLLGYWESDQSYQQIVSLRARGERLYFTTNKPNYQEVFSGEGLVTAGVWHRVVIHMKFHNDPNQGEVSVWFNGEKIVDAVKSQTHVGDPAFIQFGMLRQPTIQLEETILVDGAFEGNTFNDVASQFLDAPVTTPTPPEETPETPDTPTPPEEVPGEPEQPETPPEETPTDPGTPEQPETPPEVDAVLSAYEKTLYPTLNNFCEGCHNPDTGLPPFGANELQVSFDSVTSGFVDRDDPANSEIVSRVAGGHSCWTGNCANDSAFLVVKIEEWNQLINNPAPGEGDVDIAECKVQPLIKQKLRLLTRAEYQNSINDILGTSADVISDLPSDAIDTDYINHADSLIVTSRHIDSYIAIADNLTGQAVDQNLNRFTNNCNVQNNAEQCARQFVESFGLKIFRRPLSDAEKDKFFDLFNSNAAENDFATGVKLVLQAMLVSSKFLYRSEIGTSSLGIYELSAYEKAAQLSYLLWQTTPDDTLLSAAASGALNSAEGIAEQAQRLLESPRAIDAFVDFTNEWLGTNEILSATKDPEIYPEFNDNIREDMVEELKAFVSHVVFNSTGKLNELYTADYTFLNQRLADYYDLDGANGNDFNMVDTAGKRGGILLLGAFHTAHAHPNETSPIERGVYVRKRMMCHNLASPSPDDDIDSTPPGLDPTLTTRQRFAKHTEDPKCQSCHTYIDDVGFGFEKFDGAGQFREVEGTLEVADDGILRGLETMKDGSETPFQGPKQLSNILVTADSTAACFVQQYLINAAGSDSSETGCAKAQLSPQFIANEGDIKQMIIDFVSSEQFSKRQE